MDCPNRIDLHVHIHGLNVNNERLDRIEDLLTALLSQGEIMSAELDALSQQVLKNTSVEEGAIVLLNKLSALIQAGAGDKAKMIQLAADLKASAERTAEALVINTPADENPTIPPTFPENQP